MADRNISERYSTNPLSEALSDSDLVPTTNVSNSNTDEVATWANVKTWIEAFTSYFNKNSDTLDDITAGTTNKHFTATDETKLDGIETSATADQTGAEIKAAYEAEADTNAFTDADHSKLDGIAAGAEVNPAVISQAEAEAGTATTERTWTAQRVAQAIAALASGSGASQLSELSDVDSTVSSPSDGDILVYRTAGSDFVLEAKPAAGSNPAIGDITDWPSDVDATEVGYLNGVTSAIQTQLDAKAATSHTHAASDINSGTLADARVAESNVTQHEAAIDHDALTNFSADEHFTQASITTVGTVTTGNVDAAVSAASTTTAGKVELATSAEATTGTDTSRAVTPDALAGSNFGIRYVSVMVFEPGTDVATGDGKAYIHIPAGLSGMNLISAHAEVFTAGTTGTTDIQIHETVGAVDMLSTKLAIDSGETGSDTAATAAVINTSNDDVTTNDLIRIDVDAVSTTAPQGLLVTLGFQLP